LSLQVRLILLRVRIRLVLVRSRSSTFRNAQTKILHYNDLPNNCYERFAEQLLCRKSRCRVALTDAATEVEQMIPYKGIFVDSSIGVCYALPTFRILFWSRM
jgi:hypothetical protein